ASSERPASQASVRSATQSVWYRPGSTGLSQTWMAPVAPPPGYWPLLSPLGRADIWETEYLQHLAPVAEGHPVRAFTLSTAARPVLARLDTAEQATFLSTYDTALHDAYPLLTDGSALMPFRRLFLVLERPANVPGAASPSHSLAHGGGSA
ncbi:MAG TPA: hypothetical protein PKD10_15775, partial [Paracoccaceae bacterium]|nr:hypothetical protein [Paracoccaceae bacterium]